LIYQKGDKAMERLTDKFDDGVVGIYRIFDRSDLMDINDLVADEITSASIIRAAEQLYAYESTGLTPEEIYKLNARMPVLLHQRKQLAEYLKAEEQGLLIKFPCKVGDTVWQTVVDIKKSKPHNIHYDIVEATITRYSIDFFCPTFWTKAKEGGCKNQLTFNAIGQTVFLTREAAESALKGGAADE
jgi:hypothetical protein